MSAYTRWYFESAQGPVYAPQGTWITGMPQNRTRLMRHCKAQDAGETGNNTSQIITGSPYIEDGRYGMRMFRSVPLGAQVISGTLQITLAANQLDVGAPPPSGGSLSFVLYAYVTEGSTTTIRGLLADYEDTTGFPATQTFINFSSPISLSPVIAQEGDTIVLEFGYIVRGAPAPFPAAPQMAGSMTYGLGSTVGAADAVVGDTDETDAAGHVDFSVALAVPADHTGDPCPFTTPPAVPVPVPTTRSQQVPCTPDTQVNNGGKGASGCNNGGVGGGHQYDGYLGDVPQHDDPVDGETLTGKEAVGVDAWIELVHTDYPSAVTTTYRRAFEELADVNTYQGGRKPAAVLSISDVEHALGNEQGAFEAATADIELSDARDRLIRELADDQELEGDEVRIKLASHPARAAGTAPRVLMRGVVQRPELTTGLRARLVVVDALFSDFGPFGPDRKDPGWTFGDLGDACPEMTEDTKAQVIPRLYGEKSDEGAVNPRNGHLKSKGLIPGYYLGRFDLTGLVDDPEPSPGRSFEAVQEELQDSHDNNSLVADFGGRIGVDDATKLQAMSAVPNSYTRLAQVIGYADLDDLMADGETAAPDNTEWGFIATGLGPFFEYLGIYASDLGDGDPEATPDRERIEPSERADILVPGINWPYANPYIELTNPDTGRVFWLTGVFVKGPLLEDHLAGTVNLAFNAIGTEDVGDGTGLPIMRAEDVKQHWLENHCFNRWSSGPYATTVDYPQWEDGTPKVRSSSFTTRQQFFMDQIGGEGLLFSWYVDDQQSTLERVQQLNTQTDSRLGVNGHGQIMDWGLDETVDPSAWDRVDHVLEVFGPLRRTSGEERSNVVTGFCDWDPDKEKFRLGPIAYESTVGIEKYKGRRKNGDPVNASALDLEDQLRWVLQRRLARLELGTTLLEATGPIGWLDRDVGEGLLFNSDEGPGADGYVDHPMIILRRRVSLQTMLVTYTLWDVRDVLLATAFGAAALGFETDDSGDGPFETDVEDDAPVEFV